MLSQAQKNFYIFISFKIATIVHILCLLASLIILPYVPKHSILTHIIDYSLFLSIMCSSIMVSIKTMQFFAQHHQYLMTHYKFTGLIIESCIAAIVAILLFLNQEITGKFVLFITDLSKKTHNNTIFAIMALLILFFFIELYHAFDIDKQSIGNKAIKNTVNFNIIYLVLKLFIIIGIAIGFMHPIRKILEQVQIIKFNTLILNFTITDFFLYIHTIIMLLIGLWITIGIYYIYKFYKKRK